MNNDYFFIKDLNSSISRVGFGCCPLGEHGWGKVSIQELITAVTKALELGVNLFDTADIYGLGKSEENLGKALSSQREKAIIATKFGVRLNPGKKTYYDNTIPWMNEALENSLRRLKTDYVDIYQIHYWDEKTSLIYDIIPELQRMRNAGKIRAFGFTNIDLTSHGLDMPIDGLISTSFEYSLGKTTFSKCIEKNCKELNATCFTWGSLGQGIFSGKYDEESNFSPDDRRSRAVYKNFKGDKLLSNIRIVRKLNDLSQHYNKKVSQLAIRWILDTLDSSIALVGIKNISQTTDLAGVLGWKFQEKHLQELNSLVSEGL